MDTEDKQKHKEERKKNNQIEEREEGEIGSPISRRTKLRLKSNCWR